MTLGVSSLVLQCLGSTRNKTAEPSSATNWGGADTSDVGCPPHLTSLPRSTGQGAEADPQEYRCAKPIHKGKLMSYCYADVFLEVRSLRQTSQRRAVATTIVTRLTVSTQDIIHVESSSAARTLSGDLCCEWQASEMNRQLHIIGVENRSSMRPSRVSSLLGARTEATSKRQHPLLTGRRARIYATYAGGDGQEDLRRCLLPWRRLRAVPPTTS